MSNAKGRPAAQRRAPQHRSNTGRHREAARTIGELAGAPAAMPTAAKIATAGVVGTSAALAVPAAAFAGPAGGHAGPTVIVVQPPAPNTAAPGPINTGKWPSSPPVVSNPLVVFQQPVSQPAVPGPGGVPPGYAGPVNTGRWPSPNPPGFSVAVEQPTGAAVTGCAVICFGGGLTPPDANGKGVVRLGVGVATAPPAFYIDPLANSEGASAKVEVTGSTSAGVAVGASVGTDGVRGILNVPGVDAEFNPETRRVTLTQNALSAIGASEFARATAPVSVKAMLYVTFPYNDPMAARLNQTLANGPVQLPDGTIVATPQQVRQMQQLWPGQLNLSWLDLNSAQNPPPDDFNARFNAVGANAFAPGQQDLWNVQSTAASDFNARFNAVADRNTFAPGQQDLWNQMTAKLVPAQGFPPPEVGPPWAGSSVEPWTPASMRNMLNMVNVQLGQSQGFPGQQPDQLPAGGPTPEQPMMQVPAAPVNSPAPPGGTGQGGGTAPGSGSGQNGTGPGQNNPDQIPQGSSGGTTGSSDPASGPNATNGTSTTSTTSTDGSTSAGGGTDGTTFTKTSSSTGTDPGTSQSPPAPDSPVIAGLPSPAIPDPAPMPTQLAAAPDPMSTQLAGAPDPMSTQMAAVPDPMATQLAADPDPMSTQMPTAVAFNGGGFSGGGISVG